MGAPTTKIVGARATFRTPKLRLKIGDISKISIFQSHQSGMSAVHVPGGASQKFLQILTV